MCNFYFYNPSVTALPCTSLYTREAFCLPVSAHLLTTERGVRFIKLIEANSTVSTISGIYPKASCLKMILVHDIIITTEATVNLNEMRKSYD